MGEKMGSLATVLVVAVIIFLFLSWWFSFAPPGGSGDLTPINPPNVGEETWNVHILNNLWSSRSQPGKTNPTEGNYSVSANTSFAISCSSPNNPFSNMPVGSVPYWVGPFWKFDGKYIVEWEGQTHINIPAQTIGSSHTIAAVYYAPEQTVYPNVTLARGSTKRVTVIYNALHPPSSIGISKIPFPSNLAIYFSALRVGIKYNNLGEVTEWASCLDTYTPSLDWSNVASDLQFYYKIQFEFMVKPDAPLGVVEVFLVPHQYISHWWLTIE